QRLGVRVHDAIPLGALEDTLAVDAAPVVAHADRHAGPLAHRCQDDLRFGLLSATPPLGLGLDAVVHRVPQQVQQRVAELVQDRAVELDFLALDPERDLLAELAGQVTHQTGESVEHLPHRRHARLDDFRLQLARQPRDLNRDIVDRRVSGVGRELVQAAAHGDELADQIHEAVEPPEVHADVAALRLGRCGEGAGPGGGATLFSAHRDMLHLARGPHHPLDLRDPGRSTDAEAEAPIELVGLERRLGRGHRVHGADGLRLLDHEERATALERCFGAERDLHQPPGRGRRLDDRSRRGRRGPGRGPGSVPSPCGCARRGTDRPRVRGSRGCAPTRAAAGCRRSGAPGSRPGTARRTARGPWNQPRTRWTASRTRDGWNGFTTKSFAPAWIASTTRACWPMALHMRIFASGSCFTISRTASIPPMSGITMSMVTRSGLSCRYFSTAWEPVSASPTTSKPACARMSLIIVRMKMASSQTRTVWLTHPP